MLVLSRRESERIKLGDSIVVTVVKVAGDRVRLGIEAPADVLVLRGELERHARDAVAAARLGMPHGGRMPSPAELPLTECSPRIGGLECLLPESPGTASSARPHRPGQTAVVRPIAGVPQRLTPHHPLGQNVDLRTRTGGCIGAVEVVCLRGHEILVVPTLQNRFKHVSHYEQLRRWTNLSSVPRKTPS